MSRSSGILVCAAWMLLASCSQIPQPVEEKAPAKPAEPISGLSALYKMYQVARSWAPDAEVLTMSSMRLADVPAVPGKAGAWQAVFTSASKNLSRSYTYSVAEEEDVHEGVFGGPQESWTGSRGENTSFLIAAVKKDTTAAYQTALSKSAAGYDKKNPGKTISLLLEKTSRFPDPVWRVIWGDSLSTSNFSVIVDAMTGEYQQTLR
jgi:hypothetical protein